MPVLPQPVISDAPTPSEVVQLAGHTFVVRDPDPWMFIRLALAAAGCALVGVAIARMDGHWFDLRLAGWWIPILITAGAVAYAAYRQVRAGFPGRKNSLLLDGTTWVSTRHFVRAILKAALAANERAGAITLVVDRSRDKGRVVATPGTGAPPCWHHATLEQRLTLSAPRPVADIVHDWLGRDSPDPWRRAVEQGVTMLRVRGLVTAPTRRWFERERFTAAGVSPADVADVRALLAGVERDRPEVWALLDEEIGSAVKQRTRAPEKSSDGTTEPTPSPWIDERAEDRKRLGFGPPVAIVVPVWGSLVLFAIATAVAAYVAERFQAWPFTLATAAVSTVVSLIFASYQQRRPGLAQSLWRRSAEWQLRQRGEAGRGELIDVPEVRAISAAETYVGSLALVPIVTTVVVSLYVADSRLLLLPAAGVAAWGLATFRRRVSKSISDAVLKSPPAAVRATEAILDATRQADTAPLTTPAHPAPAPIGPRLRLDIRDMRTPGVLPAPSAASQARLDAVRQRPITMRAHFRRGVLAVSCFTLLVAIAGWLMGTARFPYTTAVLALATAIGTGSAGSARIRAAVAQIAARLVLGQAASVTGGEIDEGQASPRPLVLSVVLGIWVVLAAFAAASLAQAPTSPLVARASAAVALIVVLLFLIWFQRTRRAIERAFPFVQPQHLLALRVFGSPHLADFLDLTNEWQWIGERLRLDGPGTTGYKLRDLVNFAAGRLDKSIVENEAELNAALADFRERPDKRLRFPLNSMQCNNLVWRDAVDRLLDRADAVVMDLASLGPQNQGVAYELGRLFARIDLARVVVLIDDSTDRAVLQTLVADAWTSMPAESPNTTLTDPILRVVDMGGPPQRRPEESRAEWQRRQVRPEDRQRLVGLLVDASLPSRSGSGLAPDEATVHWSRSPLPQPARLFRNFLFALFLLFQVVTIAC